MSNTKLASEAARIMGSVTSERKRAAALANGLKRQLVPLASFPCTCSTGDTGPDDAHKTHCARGRAWRRRNKPG